MIFIFYGPEGSGKTTQAKKLSQRYKLPYLSTGDIVRFYAQHKKGKLASECTHILKNGIYLSDKSTALLLAEYLSDIDLKKGLVLDGYPRNLSQAHTLDKILYELKQSIDKVFYLHINQATAIKRLLKRKRDRFDSQAQIKNRLQSYLKEEKNTLSYYQNKNMLVKINACPGIDDVFTSVCQVINQI